DSEAGHRLVTFADDLGETAELLRHIFVEESVLAAVPLDIGGQRIQADAIDQIVVPYAAACLRQRVLRPAEIDEFIDGNGCASRAAL
ncbi:hypothetical protein ACC719_34960, partial [Rhizobium ruizarguesonis]